MSFVLVLSVVSSLCFDEFKMCLLWLSVICLVLYMQLKQILIVLQLKIFPYFVVFWEVLVSYGKESVSDIVAYIFVEWGVVPTYVVLLTVFLFFSCGCFIMKSGLVSAFVECFLIWSRPSISEST